MKKLIVLRRCSQIFFLSLFVYVLWSTTYPLKGFVSPQILFKVDPLIMFFTAISERVLLPGLIFSFIMIGLVLVFGRFFCGWVCPLGAVIDGVGSLKKKPRVIDDDQNKKVRQPKFIILAAVFLFSMLGIQLAWILDPIVILGRVVSLNVIPGVTLGMNKIFIFLIQRFELYGGFYDFYRGLKESFLGVNAHFFANSLITFSIFFIVCLSALGLSRAWCRTLCPLGAFYAFFSRFSLFGRRVDACSDCGICRRECRMGAIKNDGSYVKSECILCMDCVYNCPEEGTCFSFVEKKQEQVPQKKEDNEISRKDFLFLMLSSITFMGFKGKKLRAKGVIRPPGALAEKQFVNSCVRCGNCMKVCITNGLQPVMLESGLEGVWTPQLVPEIGYCEYKCNLCGNVCPTGAIAKLSLDKKINTMLGIAEIDKTKCIAWAEDKECLVCEEHCPVADKAIKIVEESVGGKRVGKPVVDERLCIGCGICQNKCPVRPARAILVNPNKAQRSFLAK